MTRNANGGNGAAGAKWIRRARRLRIYERDRYRCVWCRARVLPIAELRANRRAQRSRVRIATLDHVVPRAHDGTNASHNLITSCARCNTKRGYGGALRFAYVLGRGWHGAALILERVAEAASRAC